MYRSFCLMLCLLTTGTEDANMDVNTEKMISYRGFLAENSRDIQKLCDSLANNLLIAVQCMDQTSGRNAARRMAHNLENIRKKQ